MTQTFNVRELNPQGVVLTNQYDADSKEDVINMIRNKGNTPIHVAVSTQRNTRSLEVKRFEGKVSLKALAIFCKQMSTMLNAGMPLIEALNVIQEQSDSKKLKVVSADMLSYVQKGEVLSKSMKRHKKVFPDILINMVESGEMTGDLDDVLDKMATHYTKENKIKQQVKSALIYPMFIGIIAVLAVIFLLTNVMPMFVGMFEDAGVELPYITQVLLNISDFIRGYWYLIILFIVALFFLIRGYFRTPKGKENWDRFTLSLPLVKGSVAKVATARFTRTLATLLGSGISLLQALEIAAHVTSNAIVIKGIDEVADDIKKGLRLSGLLKRVKVFPPMMTSMIRIGEESGALEDMLNKSADFYEEELEESIKRLTSMIEPAMILVMALVVGFIVIAMMLPLFDMFQVIK